MEPTQPGPWQWLSQTVEAVSVCADTNLNILRQLTDFSANVARENVSLGASLQASNIEAMQEGQAYVFRRLSALSAVPQHPLHYSQSSLHESASSAANRAGSSGAPPSARSAVPYNSSAASARVGSSLRSWCACRSPVTS